MTHTQCDPRDIARSDNTEILSEGVNRIEYYLSGGLADIETDGAVKTSLHIPAERLLHLSLVDLIAQFRDLQLQSLDPLSLLPVEVAQFALQGGHLGVQLAQGFLKLVLLASEILLCYFKLLLLFTKLSF